jgi:hypothetical protein
MHVIKPVAVALVSSSEPENDAPDWLSATTYDVGSQVIRSGTIYVSTIAGNVGRDPLLEVQELEGVRWLYRSATNARKFLDGSLSTATVGASPLVIEVQASERFNAFALFDLVGAEAVIEVVDGANTREVARIKTGVEPVNNWLSWLYSTFNKTGRRFVIPNVAGYQSSTIRITITGDAPSIGEVVVGRRVEIGKTLMNATTSVRRKAFTSIATNVFGITTVTKRAIARDVTYAVHAKRDGFEPKGRFLDDVDGVKVVTYANLDRDEFINFGFITDYELSGDLPNDFVFEITVQGVS